MIWNVSKTNIYDAEAADDVLHGKSENQSHDGIMQDFELRKFVSLRRKRKFSVYDNKISGKSLTVWKQLYFSSKM